MFLPPTNAMDSSEICSGSDRSQTHAGYQNEHNHQHSPIVNKMASFYETTNPKTK